MASVRLPRIYPAPDVCSEVPLTLSYISLLFRARFYAKQTEDDYGYRDSNRSTKEGLGESRHTRTAHRRHIIAANGGGVSGCEARASLARVARCGFPASSGNKLPAIPLLSRAYPPCHVYSAPATPRDVRDFQD